MRSVQKPISDFQIVSFSRINTYLFMKGKWREAKMMTWYWTCFNVFLLCESKHSEKKCPNIIVVLKQNARKTMYFKQLIMSICTFLRKNDVDFGTVKIIVWLTVPMRHRKSTIDPHSLRQQTLLYLQSFYFHVNLFAFTWNLFRNWWTHLNQRIFFTNSFYSRPNKIIKHFKSGNHLNKAHLSKNMWLKIVFMINSFKTQKVYRS